MFDDENKDIEVGASAEGRATNQPEIVTLLTNMNAKLDALLKERRVNTKRLLSLREAARQLGISRDKTLHEMIARKQIKTVQLKGKLKIPASEVERIALSGTPR